MGEFYIQPGECSRQAESLKQIKVKLESARQQIAELRKEISHTQTYETLSRALQSVEDELKVQETASEAMGNALNTIVGLYKKTDGGLEFKEQYQTAKQKNKTAGSGCLDQWLNPDYKLSAEEKKKARDMLDDYFAEGTTARELRDLNNSNYAAVLRNSMSDEELKQYQKMIALSNKMGSLSSIAAGILGGTFLGSLQDLLNEYLFKAEGYTFLDTSRTSSFYANSLKQNKLGTLAGAFAANVALWELGSEALGGIWKTVKGGGKVAGDMIESGSRAAENVVESSANRNIVDDMEVIADDIANFNKKYSDGYQMNNSVENILNSASYYDDPYDQVAAVTRSIVDHVFANGNKRTAMDTLNMLLNDFGLSNSLTDVRKWDLIYDIAEGRLNDVKKIANILKGK